MFCYLCAARYCAQQQVQPCRHTQPQQHREHEPWDETPSAVVALVVCVHRWRDLTGPRRWGCRTRRMCAPLLTSEATSATLPG